jgi:hypothetical protein
MVEPDLFFSSGRDAQGRFAAGHSGNLRGRPKGIPNPRRRAPDLRIWTSSPEALVALLRRKPDLMRPLLDQLLLLSLLTPIRRRIARTHRRAAQKAGPLGSALK